MMTFQYFCLFGSKDDNNICFTAYCSEALPSNPTNAWSNYLNGHTIVGKIKTYTCITGYEFNTTIPTNSGSQGKKNSVLIFYVNSLMMTSDSVLTREIKATCTSSERDVPKWIFDYSFPTSCTSN